MDTCSESSNGIGLCLLFLGEGKGVLLDLYGLHWKLCVSLLKCTRAQRGNILHINCGGTDFHLKSTYRFPKGLELSILHSVISYTYLRAWEAAGKSYIEQKTTSLIPNVRLTWMTSLVTLPVECLPLSKKLLKSRMDSWSMLFQGGWPSTVDAPLCNKQSPHLHHPEKSQPSSRCRWWVLVHRQHAVLWEALTWQWEIKRVLFSWTTHGFLSPFLSLPLPTFTLAVVTQL